MDSELNSASSTSLMANRSTEYGPNGVLEMVFGGEVPFFGRWPTLKVSPMGSELNSASSTSG